MGIAPAPARERSEIDQIGRSVVDAVFAVHVALGPGLLENAYEQCLCHELALRGLRFSRQLDLPVTYKGIKLDCGYRVDLLVEDCIIVELKCVESTLPIHRAQLLTYLKLSGCKLGYLVNFNVPLIKNGIKRLVNGF